MSKEEKYIWELIAALQKISHDKKLINEFFIDLLTPAEYKDIPLRWQIVKQLKRGVPQRKIAKNLGVSISKITRGSRMLLNKKGGFNKVFKKYNY